MRYPFTVMRERIRRCEGRVLDFAIGTDEEGPPQALLDVVRDHPELALRRTGAVEVEAYQAEAVRMLAREYDLEVEPDCVLPTPGGRAALAGVVASLLTPGDIAVIAEPAYPTFSRVAAKHGIRTSPMVLHAARGFSPDLSDIASIASRARLIALNYPNNPTGVTLPGGLPGELGSVLAPDAVVFNDATLAPLTYAERPRSLVGAAAEAAIHQPVLELHSLSKAMGLVGLPVAFLVGSAPVIASVRTYVDFVWTPPSALQSMLATSCLRDPARLASARARFGERIGRLHGALTRLGFRPYPAPSGLYVLCPVPASVGGRAVKDAWEAADELLDRFGVAAMPWEGPEGGFLRFAAMHRSEDLEALEALGPSLLG